MLCGQKESLVLDNDMKALVETIDEVLKVLGKKRMSTGCTFSFAKLLKSLVKKYLEENRVDDMVILLNALANGYRCKVILYQYKNQSIIVDTISPGRVESEKELEMFYFNEHYELIFPFSETVEFNEHSKHPSNNEQFNGTFFEELTTTETLPNSLNSTLSSTPESISYLNENFQLPIFSERVEPFSIQDVYGILIEENHFSVTCEQVPSSVKSSAAFIIDLTKFDCIDDIKSNDGESMTHHGQVLRQVYRYECDNIVVRRRFTEEDHEEGYIYVYEHVSKTKCKKFWRRLYTLYKDMKKQDAHRYALLHVQIDDDYTYTQTLHANSSSCNKPYIKTMKSTINKLKEAGIKQKPKVALHQVSQKLGSSSSSGQQPKNYNQASYARNIIKSRFESMKNPVDDLLQAVYMCKKPSEKFFREVQSAPDGMCVIDTQLNDVSRFCAIPKRGVAEVLPVDLTFKLGEFYVLVTSFKNPMFINKLGKHPTHIGPVQIQHRKLLSSYRHFGSSL